MDGYLNAWYKFVPHQSKMDASNCWYVENFNTLPDNLSKKLKRLVTFHHFQRQYSADEVEMILSKIFNSNDTAVFSTQPTNHHFCLPNINLIGFTKTGSTFLYEYLALYPLLAEPHTKEGQFWRDTMEVEDPKYQELAVLLYLFHFYGASRQIQRNPDMFTIDATVSTAFATSKPLREVEKDACIVPLIISQTMPKIKLLVQTRNPINRLWSDFFFFCNPKRWTGKLNQLEKNTSIAASVFHNYTVTALQEFSACIESGNTQLHCTTLAGSYPAPEAACKGVRLGVSMYYVHLIKWFRIFPREQLHVTRLEDLVSDPSGTMAKVWDFLCVPLDVKFQTIDKKIKPSKWNLSDSGDFKMLPETMTLLRQFFHPYNVKLAELLDDERFLWTE